MSIPQHDIDRLNAARDGLADRDASPPDAALAARLAEAEAQLKKAFDPSRAQQFVFADPKTIIADQQSAQTRSTPSPSPPLPSPPSPSPSITASRSYWTSARPLARWAAMITVATLVAIGGVYVISPPKASDTLALVAPSKAFESVLAGGLKPSWVCTVDELPARVADHFGGPSLALADLPADVQVLGWTEPYYTRQQVLEDRELVLMARKAGEPVILIIGQTSKVRSRPQSNHNDARQVHVADLGPFTLVEVSSHARPVLLQHVQPR
jgi:hypothetical protein